MPQRNVASNFTFEQQRVEINNLAQDFWTQKGTVDTAAPTYLKHDGSNAFTGQTLAVPNAFTINSNSGNGTVTIAGNLQVDGTTTTVNTATMDVVDKNITIAKGSANDAAADGAGITIDSGTDITFNFVNAKDALVSSIGLEATTFIKSTRAQFTGAGNPTTGQGLELTAPDQNTGQIASYDRDTPAYKELRLKGSSVSLYTGTTNALVGSFNSTGLTLDSGSLIIPDSIIHSGDGNTKIRFPSDDNISFETGGNEKFTINDFLISVKSGFQLGFLATSGPSPSIKSGGTDNQSLLLTTGTGNPPRVTIAPDGKVVIGANAANGTLSVTGNIIADDGTNARITLQSDGTNLNQITSTTTGFGSYCAMAYMAADHKFMYGGNDLVHFKATGQVQLFGATGKATTGTSTTDLLMANGAAIRFRRANDSNWINTIGVDNSDNLKLGWGGSVDEIHFGIAGIGQAMTLNANGNLGIGGTNPSQPLTLKRSSSGQGAFGLRFEWEDTTAPASTSSAILVGSTGLNFKNYNSGRHFIFETGNVYPSSNGTQNLGTGSNRWLDVYTENLNVTKADGNLSTYITATNGLGTIEVAGSTGAFIDLKKPTSDDFDIRIGTSGTGGYINTDSNSNLSVNCPIIPDANGQYDLGANGNRWQNIYTSDLQLSNEAKGGNDVDGTWGDFTIQEGESDLYLINNRNGKKFKFNLTEVS